MPPLRRKVRLRLPQSLVDKAQIEAATRATSLNALIVGAVQSEVRRSRGRAKDDRRDF
jgi:predicted HicB family RNase H-like nuclease